MKISMRIKSPKATLAELQPGEVFLFEESTKVAMIVDMNGAAKACCLADDIQPLTAADLMEQVFYVLCSNGRIESAAGTIQVLRANSELTLT